MGGLLILSLLVGFIALIFISISKNQIAIKEIDKYISYNGINGAVLKERNQINGKYLTIKPVVYSNFKYNPAKVTYTGASVGGITTGGFHTTEAHYTQQIGGVSGKYSIEAKSTLSSRNYCKYTLKEIILKEPELIESAKSNKKISKFLVENKLVLENKEDTQITETEKNLIAENAKAGDVYAMYNIAQRSMIEKELTKEDCQNVINWICGIE